MVLLRLERKENKWSGKSQISQYVCFFTSVQIKEIVLTTNFSTKINISFASYKKIN